MNTKTIGTLLLIAGIIVLIVSLAADMIGIRNTATFGPYQIAGAVVGVIVAVIGLVIARRQRQTE